MYSSKRTISSLILAILLVGGAWYLSADANPSALKVAGERKANPAISDIDTDNDGLKDWEERLWKTDSNDTDSDGDGTTDGEEVLVNRDPAVAGPNDSLDQVALSKNRGIKAIAEDKSLNVSESIGRSIFSSYLSSKTNGESQSDQLAALEVLLAEKLPPAQNYTLADLNISSANTKEAYKLYGNALATALQSGETQTESELTIFARAVEKKDAEELAKLDGVIDNLQKMTVGALAVPVPKASSASHLDLILSLEAVKYDLEGMKLVFTDPALAFLALNSYQGNAEKLLIVLQTIRAEIQASGATFGSTEAGYKTFGR